MAQWGKTDDAANSVSWGASNLNLPANTANQTALFGNTTADAFVTGATIGQFGVDTAEAQASRADGKPTSAGWVLETVGSGGRAGRVTREVLVAMSGITGDAEDASFPDLVIRIVTQPADDESASGEAVTFSVVGATTPAGGTLTYQWQEDSGSGFANITEAGVYSDVDTATLAISDNTGLDGNEYRCVVSATGADSVNSAAATLTESA